MPGPNNKKDRDSLVATALQPLTQNLEHVNFGKIQKQQQALTEALLSQSTIQIPTSKVSGLKYNIDEFNQVTIKFTPPIDASSRMTAFKNTVVAAKKEVGAVLHDLTSINSFIASVSRSKQPNLDVVHSIKPCSVQSITIDLSKNNMPLSMLGDWLSKVPFKLIISSPKKMDIEPLQKFLSTHKEAICGIVGDIPEQLQNNKQIYGLREVGDKLILDNTNPDSIRDLSFTPKAQDFPPSKKPNNSTQNMMQTLQQQGPTIPPLSLSSSSPTSTPKQTPASQTPTSKRAKALLSKIETQIKEQRTRPSTPKPIAPEGPQATSHPNTPTFRRK